MAKTIHEILATVDNTSIRTGRSRRPPSTTRTNSEPRVSEPPDNPPRLTVVGGPNGVGKSSFVSALQTSGGA